MITISCNYTACLLSSEVENVTYRIATFQIWIFQIILCFIESKKSPPLFFPNSFEKIMELNIFGLKKKN